MSEIQLTQQPDAEGEQLLRLLDSEITEFERWMQANLGGGLVQVEKAILRTYLAWKVAPTRFKG